MTVDLSKNSTQQVLKKVILNVYGFCQDSPVPGQVKFGDCWIGTIWSGTKIKFWIRIGAKSDRIGLMQGLREIFSNITSLVSTVFKINGKDFFMEEKVKRKRREV